MSKPVHAPVVFELSHWLQEHRYFAHELTPDTNDLAYLALEALKSLNQKSETYLAEKRAIARRSRNKRVDAHHMHKAIERMRQEIEQLEFELAAITEDRDFWIKVHEKGL